MIPAKIHYCWFGDKPLGKRELACLDSWKKHCPEFELVLWDEGNSPLEDNRYVRQAYEGKKWAFVSDYVRLKAVHEQGGFYLDTDVELLSSLAPFREHRGVMGFEDPVRVATCLMGAEAGHPFFRDALEEYSRLSFVKEDGSFDYTTNVERISQWLEERGLRRDGTAQRAADIDFYPARYFSPKDLETGKITLTKDTCAIHHFQASWMPAKNRRNMRLAQLLGPNLTRKIKTILGRE